ncbi:MAG: 16S rRNA (cytosine(1402)-N(4))-methyltransferase RsmH [Bacilli bacterium]|nr:16S rRNA (cytosine(1402)-N(4))-methyltransferase RsmH [Bacilli bacterium]
MHISVLLNESIEGLNLKEDGIYVDCTLGYGGHSSEILKKIKKGYLFAIDQDKDAIKSSKERLSKIGDNFTIIKSNFSCLKEELKERNVNFVDGFLFDLGVSSVQLDETDRGFSYHNDAKLDMRMDQDSKFSAYDVVNGYSESKLREIFYKYGEEKYSSSIARNIVKYRENKKIETTLELVDIIKSSMPAKELRNGHPARKTFQAIRIEVNHELEVLEKGLISALDLINVGGRICVITFHSLEDRIVKNIFKKYSEIDSKFAKLPFVPDEYMPKYKIVCKGITASEDELIENNRARSARLRVIERIKD